MVQKRTVIVHKDNRFGGVEFCIAGEASVWSLTVVAPGMPPQAIHMILSPDDAAALRDALPLPDDFREDRPPDE